MNINSIPKITKDVCANGKILRRLEREGRIELYINNMEMPERGSKISKRNSLPFGFMCENKKCKCHDGVGGFGDDSDEFPDSYWLTPDRKKIFDKIKAIIGSQHRRDCKQVFHHHINKRNIFVTEDNDILSASEKLREKLGIIVQNPEELKKCL